MEAAVPIGEEQPEEKEKFPQPDVENCAAVETVASTDCTDSRKEATGMDVTNATVGKEEEKENAIPQGRAVVAAAAGEEAKTSQTTDGEDALDERIIELNSSPEKMPPVGKTKEDAPKSPELEVYSIDDDEEHEEEEEEEEMDDDGEEEYDEMDEEYEVYVEEKESANPHNSMDDDGSKLDLSTDEYTDEDADEQTPEKMEIKSASTLKRKTPSSELEQDEEEEDDDDDVQIISYDEEIEEDDEVEDEIEEEEDEEDSDPDDLENVVPKRHVGKSKSDSGSGRGLSGLLKRSVKYRSYKQKQLASIRKRTIRTLNRRSMHVMEDNDDARAVSSDCKVTKLATDLHSVFATPKQTGLEDILLKVQEKNRHASAAITSTVNQNETKDTGIAAGGEEGDPKVQAKELAEAGETATNTISSTTSPNLGDKMPTATAVEVSEKIADSSDDAVSVLSSSTSAKKSVTAITPTVNSSASTEAVEQKAKATEESTTNTTSKAGDVPSPDDSSSLIGLDEQQSNSAVTAAPNSQKEVVSNEKNEVNPSQTAIAEPTADDVMEGIDDFMEHTGSEDDEEKQRDQEFNEDLTFQMDVDPPAENSSSISNKERNVESAIDLTSTSEQPKEKAEESSSSETHPVANVPTAPSTTPMAVSSTKEAQVNMHDKTVVTSTPVTNQKKSQPKRTDREQEAASSSLEVKQEHEEESDGNVAQNLSKQKSSEARGGESSAHSAQKAVQSDPSASRKRRRSVEIEEDRSADSEEPVEPAKKLKLEVEANYQTHERVVNEYIETTQNTSVDEIQNHTDALVKEIQALNDMIRETEIKWNNLLHLKKVKEEILLRLNRRKHVIGIMDTQLGEVSVYSHLDSSNLSSQHHHQQQGGRSSSVGPRPPTPPPEVEIRPASVTNSMHYAYNNGSTANGGDKPGNHFGNHSRISNRRSSSNSVQTSGNTSSKTRNAKDTNSFVSQFNSSNNAVTMVPLPNTASMILNARASMNAVEVAKEKSAAIQIQRQILSKPILSNHQQILNNLAMSAGLTGSSSSGVASGSNNSSTGLLNGHHNPGGSNSAAANQQQLQIGRQGMRKDVSSIIADYRQKHPENVPRRGRRLKNLVGNSASNNGTSAGNSIGSFGEGGAISLTALSGGKSPANVRPNSTDSVANRISELLAAAEQSPQQQHQQHHQAGNLHQQQSSLLSKASLPEVTLHPVMNSTAHSDVLGGSVSHGNGSLTGANLSAVNNSTNSLLHGILTKSANRPGQTTSAAAAAAAAAVGNFNTFSPTLARLLTVPERMNSQSSSTVTSGALANLQTNNLTGGLNLSKNINEISITPVVGSNFQQTLLAQQQQQQTLQRLREQQLYNLDDEADDSADRLVIDEGDDLGHRDSGTLHGGKRRGAEINENEVPQCQGCKKQEAKFVCAGCGNQWYCSRACQVNAWDDHSEVCSG